MNDNNHEVLIKDNGFFGRLSFPGKILSKLLNDDQFYRDAVSYTHLRAHET